jgi:hypothetical protein
MHTRISLLLLLLLLLLLRHMRRESASIRPSISVCASLRENIENSFTANDGRFTQLAITMTFFFLRRNWLCG